MISTYASYQFIMRDLGKSMERAETQPTVQREAEYYLANITKVKSIDDFIKDDRLFRFAMKAHGLEDMAYAKAFIRKVLEGGIDDPNSFANKLTDKRYQEFARSFDFKKHGADATVYNAAQQGTVQNYLLQATLQGIDLNDPQLKQNLQYYQEKIGSVRSIDDFLKDDRIYTFAMRAHGFDGELPDKALVRKVLEGGLDDPESLANTHKDGRFKKLAASFDFARLGENATTANPAQRAAIDKFLRQTIEEDAGSRNEGVRLALYFQRQAPKITNAYQILGDPALARVVRTFLGLPDEVARMDIDKQAKMIESRIDLADFKDPKKLEEFMTRFTTMWEMSNPTASPHSAMMTLFQPPEFGISTDLLMTIASMKR